MSTCSYTWTPLLLAPNMGLLNISLLVYVRYLLNYIHSNLFLFESKLADSSTCVSPFQIKKDSFVRRVTRFSLIKQQIAAVHRRLSHRNKTLLCTIILFFNIYHQSTGLFSPPLNAFLAIRKQCSSRTGHLFFFKTYSACSYRRKVLSSSENIWFLLQMFKSRFSAHTSLLQ